MVGSRNLGENLLLISVLLGYVVLVGVMMVPFVTGVPGTTPLNYHQQPTTDIPSKNSLKIMNVMGSTTITTTHAVPAPPGNDGQEEKAFSMKKAVRKVIKPQEVVHVTTPDTMRFLTRRESELIADVDQSDPCLKFVDGDPDKDEFYSPGYPANYPNHTDCVRTIEAPPGHLLRLDFRDEFHVEPSDGCRFDYLEVRDGAHGYSNLIGAYCGHDFPPMLTSSDRYLWLRFYSDENIQYSGFRAVYTYIPKPTSSVFSPEVEMCKLNASGSEGYVNKTDIPEYRLKLSHQYGLPVDCMWVIKVDEGWKIMLQFLKFKMEKPNDCDSNFVDVFSDRTDLPSRLKNFCGSIADSVTSQSNILHLRFFAEARAVNSSFDTLFTAFRDKPRDESCLPEEYDCEDATCISRDLRCNGRINCRFRWDEDECKPKFSAFAAILESEHIIIILVVFCLILFGMCFAFLFNCTRKLVKDQRIIRDHMRQMREQAAAGNDNVVKKERQSALQATLQKLTNLSTHTRSRSNSSSGISLPNDIVQNGAGGAASNQHSQDHSMSLPKKRSDEECYVPGGEIIPIYTRQSVDNNEYDGDIDTMDDVLSPLPEMRDNECQTRESLFATQLLNPSPTPPPIAPRIPTLDRRNTKDKSHSGSVVPFSTFGYTDRVGCSKKDEKRYRAEAVIEMETKNNEGDSSTSADTNELRPFSIDSTKSAPDVIVTH